MLRSVLVAAYLGRVTLSDSLPSVARAAVASSAPLKRRQKSHSPALASIPEDYRYLSILASWTTPSSPNRDQARNRIDASEYRIPHEVWGI
jgi:hypothetical protein